MKKFYTFLGKIFNFILHSVLFFFLLVILLIFIVFYAYPINPTAAIVILSILTLPTFLKWDTALLSIGGVLIYLLPHTVEYGEEIPFLVICLTGIITWELSVYISLMSPKRWRKVKVLCKFWFFKLKPKKYAM